MKGYEPVTTDEIQAITCGDAKLIGEAYDKFKAKNPKFVEWLKRGKRIGLACGESVFRKKLGGSNLRKFFIVLLMASLSACGAAEGPPQAGPSSSPGPDLSGVVTDVRDGDTLEIESEDGLVVIRLAGVDSPENSQAIGQESKIFTSVIALGGFATVKTTGSDRYGRLIGEVSIGGINLNQALVASGMAWFYEKYSEDENLRLLQTAAQSARVGVWSGEDPVAPWDFREAN